MGLFVYTQKASIISTVDLPTTEIIEPEFWQVAHSQVYPELKRMTKEELITCHAVPGNEKEKQYAMTATGRQILDEWLSIPNEETPQQRDLFSIKMFFIREKDDPRIPGLLQSQIDTQQKSKANQSSVFKPLSTNNWF